MTSTDSQDAASAVHRSGNAFDGITLQNMLVSLGLLFVGALISFATTWYWADKAATVKAAEAAIAAEQKALDRATASDVALKARVSELEMQLSLIRQSVEPLSVVMQKLLVKEPTHYHTPVMDALLVKLGLPNTLTPKEESELIIALEKRTRDMGDQISDAERDAAGMLPFVMRRVKRQTEVMSHTDLDVRRLKVVTIPDTTAPDVKEGKSAK